MSGAIRETEPTPQDNPSPLGRLGDYDLIAELARGGMGIVFKARQISLDRTVAVKVLLFGDNASASGIKRLRAEAVAAGSLKHPNIVSIHEVGMDRGQHYMVMDYIEGSTLAQLSGNLPLPNGQAAVYVKKIADAIQHAHERGILHRDLKPANILVDLNDEPHVTDFGLAKNLEDQSCLTITGQVLGSPNYMAPEQARGRSKIRPACDVYGVGAVLYHLLTGRAPVIGENMPDTIRRVIDTEPIAPRLLNPAVAPDLETICLKCLEKDPLRRYASAREVSLEIDRYLKGEPITARPLSGGARAARWVCRNRATASALFLLTILAIGSPLVAVKIARQRHVAEQHLYVSNVLLGMHASESDNLLAIGETLKLIDASPQQRAMRGWEARYLRERCRGEELAVLPGHETFVAALAFSPDDKFLASIGEDGVVKLWDTKLRRVIDSWPAHIPPKQQRPWRPFHSLVFLPNGACLITAGADGLIHWWDLISRQPIFSTTLTNPVTALTLSGDGRTLAAGTDRGSVAVVDLSGKAHVTLHQWRIEAGFVYDLAILGDETLLAAADRTAQQWTIAKELAPRLTRNIDGGDRLALTQDGTLLAALASDESGLRVWGLLQFEKLDSWPELNAGLGLQFSNDGKLLASGGQDGKVTLISTATRRIIRVLGGHTDEVRTVAFSKDGNLLASGGCDKSIRLWDVAAAQRHKPSRQHGKKVQDVCFLRDSLHYLSLGREARTNSLGEVTMQTSVKLWHIAQDRELASVALSGPSMLHNRLSLAPDERSVTVNDGNTARSFSLPALQLTSNSFGSHQAYSADGQTVLFYEKNFVNRADAANGEAVLIGEEKGPISHVLVSPDGKTAVTRHHESEGEFAFWNTERRAIPTVATNHWQSSVQFVFSPEGSLLASASWDRTVGLWDVKTRRNLAILRGHASQVDSVAFSPDGRTLASGSLDGTVRLWHLATFREMAVLNAGGGVTALAFSPDGQWLVGGLWNGEFHMWRAPLENAQSGL